MDHLRFCFGKGLWCVMEFQASLGHVCRRPLSLEPNQPFDGFRPAECWVGICHLSAFGRFIDVPAPPRSPTRKLMTGWSVCERRCWHVSPDLLPGVCLSRLCYAGSCSTACKGWSKWPTPEQCSTGLVPPHGKQHGARPTCSLVASCTCSF